MQHQHDSVDIDSAARPLAIDVRSQNTPSVHYEALVSRAAVCLRVVCGAVAYIFLPIFLRVFCYKYFDHLYCLGMQCFGV